jgi:CDGSH-type Zn-finger protein/truncated hemoglobin YjbI
VDVTTLLAEARPLVGDETVGARVRASVIGPLERELGATTDGATPLETGGTLAERVTHLGTTATALRVEPGAGPGLLEATAALQALVEEIAPESMPGLENLQAELPPSIVVAPNGPLLVTNAPVHDWLEVGFPARPQVALCRCGRSGTKPYCDGFHVEAGFSDAKDPNRVPDRRDAYDGQQVTIFDNRGLCAHSGFCSDRLSTVFHADSEPFVTPSGGRLDEIVRAVRACPSGALSFGIDGHEAREQVDQPREPAIEVSKDGPYRVTGGIALLDAGGNPVERNAGASLEHYSLCRCGQSQNKPFCSGMHWYVSFRDPEPARDREPTLFDWAGGFPALLRMTRIFYGKYVPEDPLLSPLFANMSPDHPERVAAWLGEVFGGPKRYSERYGTYHRMLSQHLGKALTEEHRSHWVTLLTRSADEAGLPDDPEFRAAFTAYIEWGSRLAKLNSTPGAEPPPEMPMPRWWWVCDAYPDARPPVFPDAAEEAETDIVLPASSEPISFDANVKHLFRERDRTSMRFAFDLWSYDDVSANADAILERLQAGTMPCDGAWPPERVAVFARWVEEGKPA